MIATSDLPEKRHLLYDAYRNPYPLITYSPLSEENRIGRIAALDHPDPNDRCLELSKGQGLGKLFARKFVRH